MEILADKGNGNYAYIDNIQEANRFLGKEFKGSMFAIAKDVKIQIEFNPKHVQAYRLIGYENRKLNAEDFKNDKKLQLTKLEQENIAAAIGIDVDDISIKATTNETMGFIGREEGVVAYAVCLIEKVTL